MKRILALSALSAMAMATAWAIGFGAAVVLSPEISAPPEDIEPPANFSLYGEVWRHVDSEFYGDRPDALDISRGAVEGVVEALEDPWSIVVAADRAGDVGPRFAAAIGAWVEPIGDGARVLAVLPDSRAEGEGLQPRDLIVNAEPLEADDEATADPLAVDVLDPLELVEVLSTLPTGHSVVVVREGEAAFAADFEPGGAVEPEPVSASELRPGVAYVRVGELSAQAETALAALLPTLEDATSLVLDLRDNPGGDLAALESVAAWFLDGDLYVTADAGSMADAVGGAATASGGAAGAETGDVRSVKGRGALVPTVVLINGGTGGTAEILAAGLAERGARLVGQASFGRDGLQDGLPLADGTIIRMTTLRWTTPEGRTASAGGLSPDAEISGRQAQLETAIELALAAGSAGASSASSEG